MRVRHPTPLPPPSRSDLEAQVAARTRDLEAARAELLARSRHTEEVDRLKNAFIANMSHEIRTPLNSVLALTQLLREGVAGPLTVDQRKYLQIIERNGQALLHLINDVLDLSRIETGHIEMDVQDIDLVPQIELVASALSPLAAAKNVDLTVKLPPELPLARGDADRLRQIVTNLVGNAIKFTESGGRVMIGAEARGDDVTVVVTDTGVGIPDAYLQRIFQEFVQVDQTLARRQGGTGLGLAIARRLARLMGGDIHVESVVARGSRFSLALPRASGTRAAPTIAALEAEAAIVVPQGVAGLPATVLVVEDNEDNLFTLRQILARRPLEIVTAMSGRQAIEICRRQPPPDLVIMDVQMPGMTGLQATGAIRTLPGGADIPIVALTAQAMKGDRERILAAGCDAYLAKPVQPNELISVVDRLLRDGAAGATISARAAPPAGPSPEAKRDDRQEAQEPQEPEEPEDGAHTPRR
ncbi:MAG TPA: ATP-binding protein [Polyangia bacterium]|jgi:signal transduction histidine kinase/DNA-binding NarL/FixJ family response regulator|nr:ATP-binding protein [Polyangia bacterium]